MEKVRYVFLIPILGFTVAIISAVMSILAGIGTRFQWWNFRIGLSVLRYSAIGGLIAVVVSFIGVIVVLFLHTKKGASLGSCRLWPALAQAANCAAGPPDS